MPIPFFMHYNFPYSTAPLVSLFIMHCNFTYSTATLVSSFIRHCNFTYSSVPLMLQFVKVYVRHYMRHTVIYHTLLFYALIPSHCNMCVDCVKTPDFYVFVCSRCGHGMRTSGRRKGTGWSRPPCQMGGYSPLSPLLVSWTQTSTLLTTARLGTALDLAPWSSPCRRTVLSPSCHAFYIWHLDTRNIKYKKRTLWYLFISQFL